MNIDEKITPGTVTLVGFGPGDPDLLTVKAVKKLETADIIFHDALIDPDYLQNFTAEKVDVGKRCGHHRAEQNEINQLMLEAALQGKTVVRLKGGDPMIFAHANEEIVFLEERGIHTEVVPGITTASAMAASLKVSLTHRGMSSSVALINGHSQVPQVSDAGTLVYYMGAAHLQQIARNLLDIGWQPATPVILVSNVSRKDEQRFVSQLGTLADKVEDYPTPLIALIGEVGSFVR